MKHKFTINNPKQLENCNSIHDVRGSVGEKVSHVQIKKRNARLSCSLLVITFCFQLGHLGLLNVIQWSHMKIISLLLFRLSCFILCLRPVVPPPKPKSVFLLPIVPRPPPPPPLPLLWCPLPCFLLCLLVVGVFCYVSSWFDHTRFLTDTKIDRF